MRMLVTTGLDRRKRMKARQHACVLLRRDQGTKFPVDVADCRADRCRRCPSPLGYLERETSPVVWVDLAVKVAAQHQGIDELARCLLADAQFADQVARGAAAIGHATEDKRPVSRHVVEAALAKPRPDRVAVTAPCCAQQRGNGNSFFVGAIVGAIVGVVVVVVAIVGVVVVVVVGVVVGVGVVVVVVVGMVGVFGWHEYSLTAQAILVK